MSSILEAIHNGKTQYIMERYREPELASMSCKNVDKLRFNLAEKERSFRPFDTVEVGMKVKGLRIVADDGIPEGEVHFTMEEDHKEIHIRGTYSEIPVPQKETTGELPTGTFTTVKATRGQTMLDCGAATPLIINIGEEMAKISTEQIKHKMNTMPRKTFKQLLESL